MTELGSFVLDGESAAAVEVHGSIVSLSNDLGGAHPLNQRIYQGAG
jgi:hypothetical protein